jgi:hypothetical protein
MPLVINASKGAYNIAPRRMAHGAIRDAAHLNSKRNS